MRASSSREPGKRNKENELGTSKSRDTYMNQTDDEGELLCSVSPTGSGKGLSHTCNVDRGRFAESNKKNAHERTLEDR